MHANAIHYVSVYMSVRLYVNIYMSICIYIYIYMYLEVYALDLSSLASIREFAEKVCL